jgi:hypothetical protein
MQPFLYVLPVAIYWFWLVDLNAQFNVVPLHFVVKKSCTDKIKTTLIKLLKFAEPQFTKVKV